MNKRSTPQSGSVHELQQELFEKQLLSLSQGLDYPHTPDIAGAVMPRLRALPSPPGRGTKGEGLPAPHNAAGLPLSIGEGTEG